MKREWKPLWFNFMTMLLLKKFKHLLRGQLKSLLEKAGEEEKASSSWHEFSLLNFRVLAFLFAKCKNNPSLLAESRIQERTLKCKKHRDKKWFIVLQQSCPVCLWKILGGECSLKYIKKKKVLTFQNYFLQFIYGTRFCLDFVWCCIFPITRPIVSAFCCRGHNKSLQLYYHLLTCLHQPFECHVLKSKFTCAFNQAGGIEALCMC